MNILSAEKSVTGRIVADQPTTEILQPAVATASTESLSDSHSEPPLPLSLSVEMRLSFYQNLLAYIKEVAGNEITISNSFKSELASVLEGFARVLRDEAYSEKITDAGDEMEQLKAELSEAKDRIIALLDEKANDRVKIASLETQLKFMPDLQAQADRAMSLVDEADTIHDELSKIRFDINKAHMSRMRSSLNRRRNKPGWWSRLRSHFGGSTD